MWTYNIEKGSNTKLRGLISEEFVRYTLLTNFPILVIRPTKAIKILDDNAISGEFVQFLKDYEQTMDFFGIGPIPKENQTYISLNEIIINYFHKLRGLNRFFHHAKWIEELDGFIIEVKSRTSANALSPFNYSLSDKQKQMVNYGKKLGLKVILGGVTFERNWKLSLMFTNEIGKIIGNDYFLKVNSDSS
ncbi:hypothetical protein [Candidatus Hodarchaeum mangrovi]